MYNKKNHTHDTKPTTQQKSMFHNLCYQWEHIIFWVIYPISFGWMVCRRCFGSQYVCVYKNCMLLVNKKAIIIMG